MCPRACAPTRNVAFVYGRASPMVSSVGAAAPAVSNVRAIGGEHGVANGGDYHGHGQEERPKNTFWQILTCRCG